MVLTRDMWRYARTVMIGHYHGDGNYTHETWEPVVKVERSAYQGWDFHLEDGCKLQSCFEETPIDCREWNPHPDVANWGKRPTAIRAEYDPMGEVIGFYHLVAA